MDASGASALIVNATGAAVVDLSYEDIFDLAAQTGNRVLRFDEGDNPHTLFGPGL